MPQEYKYRIDIEYDGTNLIGWQRQPYGTSVQKCLENAIFNFSHQNVRVHGAGRTDSGVHALGQVAHFTLPSSSSYIPPYNIKRAINHFLCLDPLHRIAITNAQIVDNSFHARFNAISKEYIYKIINRDSPLTIMNGKALLILKPLNIEAMQEATQILVGRNNFSTFRSTECQAHSPIKTLDHLSVQVSNDIIEIKAIARSFLHNQVRIMVGGLCAVGTGSWSISRLKAALLACNRIAGPKTAPACGLYLVKVNY